MVFTKIFSWKLLVTAQRGRRMECQSRRAVCNELLDTASSKLHIIAVKLKLAFRSQLEFCAKTCECRLELWILIDMLGRFCPSDTQYVEGFNSTVANVITHAPAIKLPLLNARCNSLLFCLCTLGANASNITNLKYSQIK